MGCPPSRARRSTSICPKPPAAAVRASAGRPACALRRSLPSPEARYRRPVDRPVASRQWTSTSPSTLARSRGWARASASPRTTERAALWIAPCLWSASLRATWRTSWTCTRCLWRRASSSPPSRAAGEATAGEAFCSAAMASWRSGVRARSALAPICRASSQSASSTYADDSSTTGTCASRLSPRTAWQNRKPSMPGMSTSERMTSGTVLRALSSPSSPPSAVSTWKPASRSRRSASLRLRTSSSTTSTRRPGATEGCARERCACTASMRREGSIGLGRNVVCGGACRRSSSSCVTMPVITSTGASATAGIWRRLARRWSPSMSGST